MPNIQSLLAPTPNSVIRLCMNVPLDNTYRNTLYWTDEGTQRAYFVSKTKGSQIYTNAVYVRDTNRIRIPTNIANVLECNYLMYQNDYAVAQHYSEKWYYAFITNAYYINDNITEIEFEIDVMQTWFFEYQIKPSFIERNHTVTDGYGEHLIDEPIRVNNYYCYDLQTDSAFRDWSVMMYAPFDPTQNYQYMGGSAQNGIWSALDETEIGRVRISINNNVPSFTWLNNPTTILQDLITNHAQLVDNVAAIIMKPYGFISHPNQQTIITRPLGNYAFVTPTESYTPRNKKLYTYPYTVLNLSDGSGDSRDYKFELFNVIGSNIQFNLHADRCPNESISCIPLYYNNIDMDVTNAMVMGSFPMCSWISNAYLNYLANNMTNIGTSFLSGALNGIMGTLGSVLMGNVMGAVSSVGGTLTQVTSVVGSAYQAFREGFTVHGAVSNATFFTLGKKRFEFRTLGARLEELKVADDFFDMYGYAIKRIGIPNRNSRPHWNYVKLQNAQIMPASVSLGMNAQLLNRIANIYNAGITFWNVPNEVGDYTLNNSPV